MKYWDISPPLSSKLAVFPGDTPFSRHGDLAFKKGDHLDLSHITTSLHIGAHADAPSHYHPKGVTIDMRDPSYYLGRCQVVRAKAADKTRLRPSDISRVQITAPRILFDTQTYSEPNVWRNDFVALSPELIDELKNKGVRLVGLDTPSVDPADSKALESHQALFRADMAVLEGLLLKDVPEGFYQLVALPLRIEEGDASPVRALLFPENFELKNN